MTAAPNVVVGGGIVGLATAHALQAREPDRPVLVLEKEPTLASHQTGRNSGVIHSGLYYTPGSLKADLAVRGAEEMKRFCTEQGITFDVPGKLVVATRPGEVPALERLLERGLRNGVPVRRASSDEIAEREPSLRAVAALVVESTGRVDFGAVAAALGRLIEADGGTIRLGEAVRGIYERDGDVLLRTTRDTVLAHRVAVCAGLQSDRLARLSGTDPKVRIVPFRGEYRELVPERSGLVRGLVYPVPDPRYPFLGVHFTRRVDGSLEVGPNAVLATRREGYRRRDVSAADLRDVLAWPGFWRLAREHWRTGVDEVVGSASKRAFMRSASRYVPDIGVADVTRAGSGVRAQAVDRDGSLVDDFRITRADGVTCVRNAPSPGATSSLAIAAHVMDEVWQPRA